MTNDSERQRETLRRWTLVLGVLQVTVGCAVGLVPPAAVAWFRGIVMAHIEFTANGVLMIVLGLLLRELELGPAALKAWFATLQLGTWSNGASGLTAAIIGTSSAFMPTMNEKFPPPHPGDSVVVSGLLLLCAVAILAALLLTLYGLARRGSAGPRNRT